MTPSNRWLPRGAAVTVAAVTLALTVVAGSPVAGASPAPPPTVTVTAAATPGAASLSPDAAEVARQKKGDPPAAVPRCEFFPPSAGPPIILKCTGPNGHGFLIVPFPPYFLVF